MKKSREFMNRLREDGERLELPESLKPEWIEETIKEKAQKESSAHGFRSGNIRRAVAAAACIALVGAGMLGLYRVGFLSSGEGADTEGQTLPQASQPGFSGSGDSGKNGAEGTEAVQDTLQFAEKSYEEIYELLQMKPEEKEIWNSSGGESGQALEESAADIYGGIQAEASTDSAEGEYGQTNIQTAGVDEADTIKNDGRYLYQLARRKEENGKEYQGIQIVDTRDGLRETAFVGRFEYPREFYVWEDLLIVIEDGYYTADYVSDVSGSGIAAEDAAESAPAIEDVFYAHGQYTKIHVYDIADRENPELRKSFTLDGAYRTSRLADGYLYGFTLFTPASGTDEKDYDAYIPKADGSLIPAQNIVCTEEKTAAEYVVMASVDLSEPEKLLDSRAVLADSSVFYVSQDSIYLASWHSVYEETGAVITYGSDTAEEEDSGAETVRDYTQILRFSYEDGRFLARAEGRVPGRIQDSFHLDQSGAYLRAVTTVTEYIRRTVTDDRTGERIGYEYEVPEGDNGMSNGLYILDENLDITGQIEGLAAGEQIYSSRFFGDTAYFVTFRQTDPLFAVDVSIPEKPELLSELKVSGFSEYLHVYSGDLLLGLGMEADEETGEQQELKLSMFDISDPAEVSEKTRLRLAGENYSYGYSPALYDHRSLLIDTEQNLIGFEVQDTRDGSFAQAYLLYSYENGAFVQKLKIEIETGTGFYESCRGTFIGDRFFLLLQDGSVREYSLASGEFVQEL